MTNASVPSETKPPLVKHQPYPWQVQSKEKILSHNAEEPNIVLFWYLLWVLEVEKILKASLNWIPSPSVKIQIMGGKVCLKCIGKTLLGVVNKLMKTKSLLTSPSNVFPY